MFLARGLTISRDREFEIEFKIKQMLDFKSSNDVLSLDPATVRSSPDDADKQLREFARLSQLKAERDK